MLCQTNKFSNNNLIYDRDRFQISLSRHLFENAWFCGVTSDEELLSLSIGYSSLVLDSTGVNLFANCTDDSIYMFNMTSLRTVPGMHEICGKSCIK